MENKYNIDNEIIKLKNDIEYTNKLISAAQQIENIINDINAAKTAAIEAHKKSLNIIHNNFLYTLYDTAAAENMKLCKLLINKLYDILSYIDYIDDDEIKDFLIDNYNFKIFNTSLIKYYY